MFGVAGNSMDEILKKIMEGKADESEKLTDVIFD